MTWTPWSSAFNGYREHLLESSRRCWLGATVTSFQEKKKQKTDPKSKCYFHEVSQKTLRRQGAQMTLSRGGQAAKGWRPNTTQAAHARQSSKTGLAVSPRAAPADRSRGRWGRNRSRALPTSSFSQGQVFELTSSLLERLSRARSRKPNQKCIRPHENKQTQGKALTSTEDTDCFINFS